MNEEYKRFAVIQKEMNANYVEIGGNPNNCLQSITAKEAAEKLANKNLLITDKQVKQYTLGT